MKLNKLFFGLLGIATLFAACKENEDDDYKWATAAGEQVYFSNDLASKVELDTNAVVFNIPVKRINAGGAITVPIQCVDTFGVFTYPTSVSFDAGQTESSIPVGYNGKDRKNFPYDKFMDITISLGDSATHSTPYGNSTYAFKAGVPAPLKLIGTGKFLDAFWFEAESDVEIYQNTLNPNEFRIMDPFTPMYGKLNGQEPYVTVTVLQPGQTIYGVTITQKDLVYYPDINTGYYHSSYGANVYMVFPGRFTSLQSEAAWAHNKVLSWQDNGLPGQIQLAPYYYMFGVGGWNQSSGDGVVMITFPDYVPKDYAVNLFSYAGVLTEADGSVYAVGETELGADCSAENTFAVVVPADADPDAVADAVAAGELVGTPVETGYYKVPIGEETGKLQVVLVVVENGEAKVVETVGFEYWGGGENPWTSLGIGLYTDDIVVPMYTEEGAPYTYEVEIEENNDTPGLYRIVKAYKPVADAFGVEGGEENVEVNAADPEGVFIDLQPIGMDLGYGPQSIVTWGAYQMLIGGAFDEVKAAGMLGTLKDGVITFPAFERQKSDGTTAIYQALLFEDSGYYAGSNGAVKLVLPDAVTPAAKKKAAAQRKAADFARRLYRPAKTAVNKNQVIKAKIRSHLLLD